MLDLVGVRFHRTSRSFWGQYGRSRKNLMFGLFQVASCPSEPWTSDNEHQKVASVICPPSPVDASWCLKNSSGWLPVQIHASGILSTQILSKHPLSILISLIWYLDVLFFFPETHPISFYAASPITLTWPTKNSRNQGARLPCTSPSLETRKSSESSILGSRFW